MNKPSGESINTITMQRYFDELLASDAETRVETAQPLAERRTEVANPGLKTQVATQVSPVAKQAIELPHREVEEDRQTQQALEVLQKQKLQALLDQQQHIQQLKPVSEKVEAKVSAKKPPLPISTPVSTPRPLVDPHIEPAQVKVPELLRWHENGRPLWAQKDFDVLLFEVSGLTLAVPLIALGQILYLKDGLTPIFGQSDWFMGLLPSPRGNIKTVNTALFVMPERYDEKFLDTARFVISIDGLPWGLAVDSVNQPSRIHPDAVKWRSNRSKRPWLAGTVKSAMCALIDIPQMGKLLLDSEK